MGAVRFIRKAGRVIPLRGVSGAYNASKHGTNVFKAATLGAGVAAIKRSEKRKKSLGERIFPIKVNRGYDALGLGLSVATGALSAATFHSGVKGFIGGQVIAHGIDAAGIAANTASVAGHGRLRARVEQGAKQEARNFIVGNGVYFAGVLAQKKTRQGIVKLAKGTDWKGVLAIGKKFLRRGV